MEIVPQHACNASRAAFGGGARPASLPALELLEVEHEPHDAIPDDEHAAVVARVDGRMAGRALYDRVYGPRAVLSIHVEDVFWHRGVPQALLASLGARAQRVGIETFLMRVPAADVRLLALLREDFGARDTHCDDHVDIEFRARPLRVIYGDGAAAPERCA